MSSCQVSKETGRITLSLKQTSCSSTDASFIHDYFLMEGKVQTIIKYLFNIDVV